MSTRRALSAAALASVLFGCHSGTHSASTYLPPESLGGAAALAGAGNLGGGTSTTGGAAGTSTEDGSAGSVDEAGSGGAEPSGNGGAIDPGGSGEAGEAGAANAPVFGPVEVVEAAVTPCAPPAGSTPVAVLPAGFSNAVYDRVGSVGARHFAFARDSQSLFTFDAASQVSSILNDVAAATSSGPELSVLFMNSTQTVLQRYDSSLLSRAVNVTVADGMVRSPALAANATATLVSWIDGEQLRARVLSGTSSSTASIPLSAAPERCRAQAVASGKNFALAWVCLAAPPELHFALLSATAKLLKNVLVFKPTVALELVAFKSNGAGYTLMLHSLEKRTTYLVNLDANGQVSGKIRGLSGLLQGFDLAVSDANLSVSAMQSNGITALGRIGTSEGLDSAGSWTCLDQTSPGGRAALEPTTVGDSILVRYGNGSEWLLSIPY